MKIDVWKKHLIGKRLTLKEEAGDAQFSGTISDIELRTTGRQLVWCISDGNFSEFYPLAFSGLTHTFRCKGEENERICDPKSTFLDGNVPLNKFVTEVILPEQKEVEPQA